MLPTAADDDGPPTGVLLTVAYDGAGFSGFAPQRDRRTVYGTLLEAARALDPGVHVLRGASRTDAGVHARGQIVALDPRRTIPLRGWVLGMNAHLPDDVAVRRAHEVQRGYEPRASRLGKRYRYLVMRDVVRDPRLDKISWRVGAQLDVARARREAHLLVGTHDFKGFRSSHDDRDVTVRTIMRAEIVEGVLDDARLMELVVEGSAFLHNMMRIVIGTIVGVASGRLAEGAVSRAIASGRRDDLGVTAPPHGLSLDEVFVDLAEAPRWP